ncbi:Mur ligase family protein [Helicobacter mehlei]|uniref:Bifunctional folylpolyglutamate synthase/dihydrofolate synthase n=1 Tax=Helicobacter mehlei TaxID=2316080 RepID=A0A553V0R7_9HELI|nr:Mur ligase family protein [Helicobacter mehlei]TSA86043.1 bifunctional folylpolyglutamate synthase/dihydrofolate synthase [Helicobacter mehlei]
MTLQAFLNTRAHELAHFDPTRFKRIYAQFRAHFEDCVPKIQIIGTNGKGSTGRFLTLGLEHAGFKVLHFSSPHLCDFAERFYKQGAVITAHELEDAHQFLQSLSLEPQISYFEYATLLAVVLARDCDYLVLEAGLGGEFDSTTRLDKRCAIVFTPISFDHTDRLGTTLQAIATTKLKAMQSLEPHTPIICAPQEDLVLQLAKEMASQAHLPLTLAPPPSKLVCDYAYKHHYPPFLAQNLQSALSTLEVLGIAYNLDSFPPLNLGGRFERIAPNLIADSAHNVSGAQVLAQALKGAKANLVYNSYARKDVRGVLACLKPLISHVFIFQIDDPQIIPQEDLERILQDLKVTFSIFSWEHFKPKPNTLWLVTGSFSVVGGFIQSYRHMHA